MTLIIKNALMISPDSPQPCRSNILIDGTRVKSVTASGDPINCDGSEVIDADDMILIPGLVNAHTHSDENFLQGLFDGQPMEIWTALAHPQPITAYEPEWIYLRTLLGAMEMIHGGITTVQDHVTELPKLTQVGWSSVAAAYRDIGMRAVVTPNIRDRPRPDSMARKGHMKMIPNGEIMQTLTDIAGSLKQSSLIQLGVGPSAPHRCSEDLLTELTNFAKRYQLPIHMHLLETRWQLAYQNEVLGKSFTEWLESIGALSPHMTVAHSIWVSPEDISRLASAGVSVAHNPVSNFKLGSGIFPWRDYCRAGVNLSLGTDGASTNDSLSLFETMKWAALAPRPMTLDYRDWPSGLEVFQAATKGGARSLGKIGEIGEIAPGTKADMVLLENRSISSAPFADPLREIVFAEHNRNVRIVIINGRVIFKDGKLRTVNMSFVTDEVRRMTQRYFFRMGFGSTNSIRVANQIAEKYRKKFIL